MKRFTCIAVCSAALLAAPSVETAEPEIGEPAPDVRLPFLDGSTADLGTWLGRQPVYLKIWATWCGTCRKEMPHFKAAYEAYGADIAFFSVNAGFNDTFPEVREFNEEYDLRMPSVVDRSGEIGQAFDLIATPYHVLIDGSGRIVHVGHAADATVDRLLARLATERHDDTAPQVSYAGTADSDAETPAPKAGDLAPPFSIETLSGSMFSVDSDTGTSEPVHLLFFTAWCESYLAGEGEDRLAANACADTRRTINAAFESAGEPPRVIGIASRMWTGPREILEYRDAHDVSYPIALDQTNEIFILYGVRAFPTLITISDGRITARREGTISSLR
jgi:peroxiredoxin